ncbi:MAG TPA: hypothetical protein VM487_15900 [Phycisphaerae bacterium]|nr:hypothetical protein [Phycisphaerae bacterium]
MRKKRPDHFNRRWAAYRDDLDISRDRVAAAMLPDPVSRDWVRRRELRRDEPGFVEVEREVYAALVAAAERADAQRLREANLEEALA